MGYSLGTLPPLPAELMARIFGSLDSEFQVRRLIARLLRCSRYDQKQFESLLYSTASRRNDAMLWACTNGNVRTIRLAVAYGATAADILHDDGVSESQPNPHPVPIRVLSLCAAVQHRNTGAFMCLLDLGDPIDSTNFPPHERKELLLNLMRQIHSCASPRSSSDLFMLRVFYKLGLHEKIKRCNPDIEIDFPLVRLIDSRASRNIVRFLLDLGADPNKDQSYEDRRPLSPLSAAVLANSADVFRLLISRGAEISRNSLTRPNVAGLQVPVFAAARMMAYSTNGIGMMRLCLANGADINQVATALSGPPNCEYHSHDVLAPIKGPYAARPIDVFLDSVADWSNPRTRPDSLEGLEFLLQHGALVDHLVSPDTRRIFQPLGLLLDKFGVVLMDRPVGLKACAKLLEYGAARTHVSEWLLKYCREPLPRLFRDEETIRCQIRLAKALISTSVGDQANSMLWLYVKAVTDDILKFSVNMTDAEKQIIRELARVGNINERFDHAGKKDVNGMTVLHLICIESTAWAESRDRLGGYPSLPPLEPLLALLFSIGADPGLRFDGESCLEYLQDDIPRAVTRQSVTGPSVIQISMADISLPYRLRSHMKTILVENVRDEEAVWPFDLSRELLGS